VDNIILRGALNFSIGYAESWGHNAQIDLLSDFFGNILEDHGLIDIPSTRLQPPWRNRRSGEVRWPEELIVSSLKSDFWE